MDDNQDNSELSLKDAFLNIAQGFADKRQWQDALEGALRLRQSIPQVAESYARGAVAQIPGIIGDTEQLGRSAINALPAFTPTEIVRGQQQVSPETVFPTTREILNKVPRVTPTHEGAETIEDVGALTAPGGYGIAKDFVKLTKNTPLGLTMIGPQSKAWNETMAFEASKLEKKLLKEGMPHEEVAKQVWQATGNVRGLDNQWRQEINDLFASMKGNHENYGKLYDEMAKEGPVTVKNIFEHPDLEEAYPHLMGIKVEKAPKDATFAGAVTFGEDGNPIIKLREDLKPQQARSVMAHELQHLIQKEEGWNMGGSRTSFEQQHEARIAGQALPIRQEAERMDPSIPWERRIEESARLHKQLGMNIHDEAIKVAKDPSIESSALQNMQELYGADKRLEPYTPEQMYNRIAGEAEARMTQGRLDLGEQGRMENFPYEYQRTQYENLQPKPNPKLDIHPEEAIVYGVEPNVISVGGKKFRGENEAKTMASEDIKPNELGYYSQIEKVVNEFKNAKGTGEQFLNQIAKAPGVKQEEIAWTGIEDYLKGKKSVTKEEVMDYLKHNKVQIKEHELGESTSNPLDEYELRGGDVYDDTEHIQYRADDIFSELKDDQETFNAEMEELLSKNPEHYEGWEENDSIAERLLRDTDERLEERAYTIASEEYYDNPIRQYYDDLGYEVYGNDDMGYSIKDPQGRFLRAEAYDISDVESIIRDHALEEGLLSDYGDGARHESWTIPGKKENYREVLLTHEEPIPKFEYTHGMYQHGSYPVLETKTKKVVGEYPTFKEAEKARARLNESFAKEVEGEFVNENHFEQPNIHVHLRLDDRMINGKKTLFIEEVQSDWHQAGREKGYFDQEKINKNLDEQRKMVAEKTKALEDAKPYTDKGMDAPQEILDRYTSADNRLNILRKEESKIKVGVPNAPFKSTWHELGMKRAIDIASKSDYDQIAWTTGEQQNSRYGLEKHIGALVYTPEGRLQAYDPEVKRTLIDRSANNIDELSDLVGKEVAEKLLNQEPNEKGFRELRGLDLKVGGSGMKGFYDKILPDYVNKHMKKYGVKVGKGKIEGEDVHTLEITPDMRKQIKEKGQPMFAVAAPIAGAVIPQKKEKKTPLNQLL